MATVPAMTMFDFEKVKVNGIITPKDGAIRSNLNVDVLLGYNTSLGDNILATTTTDGNGQYNLEFFIPSGSYMHVPMICCGDNKKAVFDVTQDSTSQTVLQVIETDLTITSTKDILSFEDNEVATINATLTYGTIPQPIEGEEISFVIKDSQNNIIDTQVSTTDLNGIASIVYESQGIGDITISASIGGFVSKIYGIQDIYKYVDGTNYTAISSNISSYSLNPMASVTPTITSDGTNIVLTSPNSQNGVQRGDLSFLNGLNNFKMSMIVATPSMMGFQLNDGTYLYGFSSESRWIDARCSDMYWATSWIYQSLDASKEYILEITVNGTSVTLKILNLDGTIVASANKTMNSQKNRFGLIWNRSATSKFRDLKVRQL